MTTPFDLDRALGQWMDADALPPAPSHVLPAVMAVTAAERPRPAWLARARHARAWPRSFAISSLFASGATGSRLRPALILALVALIVALLGGALIIGSRHRPPPPFGPAANGLVVYATGGDLFTGDPITGESRRITAGPEQDDAPVFSPDGTHVVFFRSSGGSGAEDIVVAEVDGSRQVVVTPTPMTGLTWLDWTPDSRSIAFISETDGRALHIAEADGSGVRTLVDDMAVGDTSFRPPLGDEIMFRGQNGDGIGIYVMRADGTGRRTLIAPTSSLNLERHLAEPRYSPDGSLIAYQRWADDAGQMRVYVMNADGTGSWPMPHDPDTWYEGWPVWSPDGTRLAIQRIFNDPASGTKLDGPPLAVIAADGRSPAVPVGSFMDGTGLRVEWSPDGTRLLASSDVDPQVILDPGGGPPETPTWVSTSYPAWQRLAP